MARPPSELQTILKDLDGVKAAYIQAPTSMEYPCILIEPSTSDVTNADNIKYLLYKGYTIIVVDRASDSAIPGLVEGLPHSRFERFYRVNGLNHFVFKLFF